MGTWIEWARRRVAPNSCGASAVEYGLLIAAIAAVVAIGIYAVGAVSNGQFNRTCDEWRTASGDSSVCS
jgi:Flp pilus assembly pilin Flp